MTRTIASGKPKAKTGGKHHARASKTNQPGVEVPHKRKKHYSSMRTLYTNAKRTAFRYDPVGYVSRKLKRKTEFLDESVLFSKGLLTRQIRALLNTPPGSLAHMPDHKEVSLADIGVDGGEEMRLSHDFVLAMAKEVQRKMTEIIGTAVIIAAKEGHVTLDGNAVATAVLVQDVSRAGVNRHLFPDCLKLQKKSKAYLAEIKKRKEKEKKKKDEGKEKEKEN